ncbi:MAG: diversity-generating retroelement protein Avd [Pseudomonadota bacterium]
MTDQLPKVIQDSHKLILWLIPLLDQFPRSRRFTLGERLESGLLDVLADLVDAAYNKQKRPALLRASRQLEITRHLWRITFELKIIPPKRYQHGAQLIDQIGRQIGGWLRQAQGYNNETSK